MTKILTSVILILLLSSACNRQVLRFFFDGVVEPVPYDDTVTQETVGSEQSESKEAADVIPTDVEVFQSIHPDYREKKCDKCHDPAQSNSIDKRSSQLCYKCHKPFQETHAVLHGPVSAGLCSVCHAPHRSKYTSLLRMPARDMCLYCHVSGGVNKYEAHQKDIGGSCLRCHDAHCGGTKSLPKTETPADTLHDR